MHVSFDEFGRHLGEQTSAGELAEWHGGKCCTVTYCVHMLCRARIYGLFGGQNAICDVFGTCHIYAPVLQASDA